MIIQRKLDPDLLEDSGAENKGDLWEDIETPAEGFETIFKFLTSLDDEVGTTYRIIEGETIGFASVELPPPAVKYVSMT